MTATPVSPKWSSISGPAAFLDWFHPSRLDDSGPMLDADLERRSRTAVAGALVMIIASAYYAARFHWTFEGPSREILTGLALGGCAVSLLALSLLRLTGKLELLVHMVLGYGLVFCLSLAYLVGGTEGTGLYWTIAYSVSAVFMSSPRSGLVYLALSWLGCSGILYLHASGTTFFQHDDPVVAARSWLSSVMGLMLSLFALVVVFEKVKESTLERLRRVQRALIEAREHVESASRAKSEFLARVTHEIRTPMTAILGFSEILLERIREDQPGHEWLRRVHRNAEHLIGLIHDILDLSRIEAGRLEVTLQPCAPVAIARDIVSLMQVRAREQGVTLEESYSAEIPAQIVTDSRRLRQILLNLVSNAIKFSAGGRVSVCVQVDEASTPEPELRLEVRDTGIGVSPEQLTRLFEPFSQGDVSTTRRFGGSGLGLSISSRLCELLDGRIEVESEPGVGSCFAVLLPLRPVLREAAPEPSSSAPSAAAPRATPVLGQRILFADDVADNRELVAAVLAGAGAQVALAEDGASALARVQEREAGFDAVILDLQMPGMDGRETVRALRAGGYTGRVLALTASAIGGEEDSLRKEGFDGLLLKPFGREELLAALENDLERERAAQEPEAPAEVLQVEPGLGRWDRLVRRLAPVDAGADPEEHHRARIAVGFALAASLVVPLWAPLLWLSLKPPVGAILAGGVALAGPLVCSLPLLLRRLRSISFVANLVAGLVLVQIGAIACFTGGAGCATSYWPLVITTRAPLLGLRHTARWALACGAFYVGLYALSVSGALPPNYAVPEYVAGLSVLSCATLAAVILGEMIVYHRAQRSAIEQLERRNRDLREAQAQAERANRSKSEFIATVSHEIRTPMTAILGFSDLLSEEWREGALPEEVGRSVEIIHRNGEHLLVLIDDLLDLSRIEAGGVELEQIQFDPRALVDEVVELLQVRAQARGLDLRVQSVALPGAVRGDPTRLRQVLLNLVSNAIKFTECGFVEVRVSSDGEWLRFEVEDSGEGIAQAEREKLFAPFYQVRAERERGEPGSGLGLAISQRLCGLLGGQIQVQSKLGKGSCFAFQVPGPAVTESCESEVAAPRVRAPTARRVLLAEDGADNQVLIERVLRKAGIEVTVVGDGEAAVAAVESASRSGAPFDLVLMDMQMPVLDGRGAARRLRSRGCSLPIVALTAHAFEDERARCLEAGCDAFATKPIDRAGLLELVQEWSSPQGRSRRETSAAVA